MVITALGMVKKGTKKYIDEAPRKYFLQEMQGIVQTSTADIFRKILSV